MGALISELLGQQHWPWQPQTVYLGGGTPSGMATEDLDRILSGDSWAVKSGKESHSSKAAPGNVTARNAPLHGLARVSIE